MKKVSTEYIIDQYDRSVEQYVFSAIETGLWQSEQYVIQKYIAQDANILDMGCGTGRTTFGMHKLGYKNMLGIDLTPAMVAEAIKLNQYFGTEIKFQEGDATNLSLDSEQFDAVLFSFNGLMAIPGRENRYQACKEIWRVLKEDGIFIFTTHDRNKNDDYREFWKIEEMVWESGRQKAELHEFGDLLTDAKTDIGEIFIHIPDMQEVEEMLQESGFTVVETFYRSDLFTENQLVQDNSGECRFWVAKKHHE